MRPLPTDQRSAEQAEPFACSAPDSGFVNTHLSVSRLKLFEQCPRAFAYRYIEKRPSGSNSAASFGTLLHRVLERFWKGVLEAQFVGRIELATLLELLNEEWPIASGHGAAEHAQASTMLREYAATVRVADHRDVLGVEQPFELTIGRFKVLGFIDRVERVDATTVRVVDYKTNRVPFTRDEVEHDLQMSVYAMAARQLWPWATRIELTFHLLRHSLFLHTERTDLQLEDARAYVALLGERTERGGEYPTRPSALCAWCEHRTVCAGYARLLDETASRGPLTTVEELVAERERVAGRAKAFYARRAELDGTLRAKLEQEGPFDAGGMRVSFDVGADRLLRGSRALRLLSPIAAGEGIEPGELFVVDRARLEDLLRKVERRKGRAHVRMLRAELEVAGEPTGTLRIEARHAARAR